MSDDEDFTYDGVSASSNRINGGLGAFLGTLRKTQKDSGTIEQPTQIGANKRTMDSSLLAQGQYKKKIHISICILYKCPIKLH